jgi:hypothetical protein
LPSDLVSALAATPDGTLWVGTGGGLARGQIHEVKPQIVQLVGELVGSEVSNITEDQHTFAVVVFDPTYRTRPDQFRYHWKLQRWTPLTGWQKIDEKLTRSSSYSAQFRDDGSYKIGVQVDDILGVQSEPYEYRFSVKLPWFTEPARLAYFSRAKNRGTPWAKAPYSARCAEYRGDPSSPGLTAYRDRRQRACSLPNV